MVSTHSLRLSPHSPLLGRTIANSGLRQGQGVTVLAITRSGTHLANPSGDTTFQEGDVLFVIGPERWDSATIS